MKLVSLIIRVYNVEKYLKRCLDSVEKQTYKNIEVLIINDGSIDKTETIILDYVKKNSNFRYYKKANGGVSSARNLGLANAKGEYISFIDGDDTIEPTFVETLVKIIKNEDSFSILSGMNIVEGNNTRKYKIKKENILLQKNPSCCIRLFQKKYIDMYNLRFEESSMGEDLEFVTKLFICNNNYSSTEAYLYNYYMNGNSLTHTYTRHVFSVMDAIDRIEQFVKLQNKRYEFSGKLTIPSVWIKSSVPTR